MKKALFIGALVLLAAAGCNKNTSQNNNGNQTPNPNVVATTPPVVTPQPPVAPPITATYAAALKTYGTNRIQFDNACSTKPNSATFKGGTKIMIDNRSELDRTISIGTTKVKVAKWDFAIITLPKVTAQKVIYGNCGDSKNDVTITLDK